MKRESSSSRFYFLEGRRTDESIGSMSLSLVVVVVMRRRWRRSNNDGGGFRFVGWLRAKEKKG
ncbi:hypothetical protein LR48_Vigan10g270900 [Vigna angularis]|uniref:Uncharacterized protein n=1 Tax=Phaseolus angularis TaxID=3914 RepID=A0A0L9VPI1_PHAAN|nr:hypothetical protein LR48_Vigan10g270900 [Vigna angularis]